MSLSELSEAQKEELITSLSVLLCHDSDVEISAENLNSAISASGNKVASYLPTLFVELLGRGLNVSDFLAGPSAGAASASSAPSAGGAAPAAAAKKEESEEEADLGGGMDMFGGGADY